MKKPRLLTPGPTPVPPAVAAREGLPVLHHRTAEFGALFIEVLDGLKRLLRTKQDVLLFACSGTGVMEAAVVNTCSPGDTALVLETGAFGERWAAILRAYGVKPVVLSEEWGRAADVGRLAETLKAHPGARAVFCQHTDTSTAIVNDLKRIGEVVAATPAMLVVDAVSGLGAEDLRMDDWRLDVVVSASQKGLMNAPGLGFASLSERAWANVASAHLPRFYWDFSTQRASLKDRETTYTPAVSLIAGLAEALRMIAEEGLDQVLGRHARLAKAMRAGLQGLGLELFSRAPCAVLTAARVPSGLDGKKLVNHLRDRYGLSIAGGQARLAGKIIRLAHLGYMDSLDVLTGLAGLELGLADLGHPVTPGAGVAAAEPVLRG